MSGGWVIRDNGSCEWRRIRGYSEVVVIGGWVIGRMSNVYFNVGRS